MSNAIQEIAGILKETGFCYLATVDGSEPHVRAFQFQFEMEGKLWFCTSVGKDVYNQLKANPAFEICTVRKDMSWLRVCGKVAFEDNRAVKERILAEQPMIKGIYGTADNPEFSVFSIEHGGYVIADFSGQPPRGGSF